MKVKAAMSEPETTPTTFRMHQRGNTLDGYVFADRRHALEWLSAQCVDPTQIMLEPVTVGELHRCSMCSGTGFRQSVKVAGERIRADEFLRNAAHAT